MLAIIPSLPTYILSTQPHSLIISAACAYSLFYTVVVVSVIGYRLSPYHPLARYPGPTIMKVTKLWGAWIAYTGKTHVYLKAVHDKYGPTVRIGPNELSTIEKAFLPHILGNQGMPKGPMWDGRKFAQTEAQQDYDNIIDLRDPILHAQLRKPWNKAFSAEPMKDYEALLMPRIMQINSQLKEICMKSEHGIGRVDIAKWISCFAFDFIGDVAFGGCFQLMREGDKDGCFRSMEAAMYLPSITQHVPCISKLMRYFPIINGGMTKFIKFGMEHALRRYSLEMKRKDLFYHMSEASGNSEAELPMIIANALLAIVAGSDTSSFTASCIMYLVLSHPEAYQSLQREVDEVFEKHLIPDLDVESMPSTEAMGTRYGDILGGMPYLNAVINEGMRLFPAVPTGLQRAPAKGSEGKILQAGSSKLFLPEGNAIIVSTYVLHRDPRHFFPYPDAFLPDRWLSSPAPSSNSGSKEKSSKSTMNYMTSRDAFVPFSLGQQNCVGRPLALMELRYVIATFMRNFEMEFDTPHYDPKQWEDKMEDRFTFQAKGTLPIRIRFRGRRGRGITTVRPEESLKV
ncbi:high nitrogen upregulated cytochrome P450 monooxygenase 2 [Flammula alnicola]|nr:high nitrogen upregulated cytochrome P450 monooxygenase 2 [Flammula alnicola]